MKLHHRLDGPDGAPLLVLGPSLGTTLDVWEPQVKALTAAWRVLRWDLPGHGQSPPAHHAFTVDTLADAVLALVEDDRFALGGISLGGAVATTIAARAPERIDRLVLCCTAATFGEPGPWLERAAAVRRNGMNPLAGTLLLRWFTPEFGGEWRDRVLAMLRATDPGSYAACCEALSSCDLRARLKDITAPTLVVAGAEDPATPVENSVDLVRGIPHALLSIVPGAHLASVEAADTVTPAIVSHLGAARIQGMRTRRAVLGDAHVDRATAATTPFTRDFQDLITRYAWDDIWNRPGLDRRMRSAVTLTALVAHGHLEELAMHVEAARRNGLTAEEIGEVLLQTAVYCGVPAANAAFKVAQRVLDSGGPM